MFHDIAKNKMQYEISRLFTASLQLVSKGKGVGGWVDGGGGDWIAALAVASSPLRRRGYLCPKAVVFLGSQCPVHQLSNGSTCWHFSSSFGWGGLSIFRSCLVLICEVPFPKLPRLSENFCQCRTKVWVGVWMGGGGLSYNRALLE